MLSKAWRHHVLPTRSIRSQPKCEALNSRFTIAPSSRHLDAAFFTLIIDDLVFGDGTTLMAQLGGGGSQAAWAYQSYSAGRRVVGLAAGVAPDLPSSCLQWFENNAIDASGLIMDTTEGAKTPRAWQIVEDDGRRHEIWRTEQSDQQAAMLLPPLSALPSAFQGSRAFHLGVHPEHPPWDLLVDLRRAVDACGGLLSVETFTTATAPPPPDALARLAALSDVFSPNQQEAMSMLDIKSSEADPLDLTTPFIEAGARWVTLRCGPAGAVVHERDSGTAWRVPAVPETAVMDTTGCGNAFCGAFLAAVQDGAGPAEAGAAGCAAGSIMAEVRGVPPHLEEVELKKRFERLKDKIERIL